MKKIQPEKQKIKPFLQLSDDVLDLRTLDTNIIVAHLEEQIKLREMPVDQQAKKKLVRGDRT